MALPCGLFITLLRIPAPTFAIPLSAFLFIQNKKSQTIVWDFLEIQSLLFFMVFHKVFQPMNIVLTIQILRLRNNLLMQRNGGLYTHNHKLFQGAA